MELYEILSSHFRVLLRSAVCSHPSSGGVSKSGNQGKVSGLRILIGQHIREYKVCKGRWQAMNTESCCGD